MVKWATTLLRLQILTKVMFIIPTFNWNSSTSCFIPQSTFKKVYNDFYNKKENVESIIEWSDKWINNSSSIIWRLLYIFQIT